METFMDHYYNIGKHEKLQSAVNKRKFRLKCVFATLQKECKEDPEIEQEVQPHGGYKQGSYPAQLQAFYALVFIAL